MCGGVLEQYKRTTQQRKKTRIDVLHEAVVKWSTGRYENRQSPGRGSGLQGKIYGRERRKWWRKEEGCAGWGGERPTQSSHRGRAINVCPRGDSRLLWLFTTHFFFPSPFSVRVKNLNSGIRGERHGQTKILSCFLSVCLSCLVVALDYSDRITMAISSRFEEHYERTRSRIAASRHDERARPFDAR